jgi:P pilus assembly chaperone PapD
MKKSILIAALIAAMSAGPVMALSVGPLAKVYTANEKTGEITITNTAKSAESYQITVDRLTLVNGEVVRTPTEDIMFAPRVVRLEAGKSQVVRFKKTSSQSTGEEYFRVRVRQLQEPKLPPCVASVEPTAEVKPVSNTPCDSSPRPAGLEVVQLMSMDFPWFWRSPSAAPILSAKWQGDKLVFTNTGNATAQLKNITSGPKSKPGLIGYVMPGETKAFTFKGFAHGPVTATVNDKSQVIGAM